MKPFTAFKAAAAVVLISSVTLIAQNKPVQAGKNSPEVKSVESKAEVGKMKDKKLLHGFGGQCRQMVPSADGGVFILMGNQLLKYDANLVLQKETEIKVNLEALCKHAKAVEKTKSGEAASEAKAEKPKASAAKPSQGKKQ